MIGYPGNEIHSTDYIDTEDFAGPLPKMFDDALAFIMRNLHKVQAGRGVNAPGLPEIPVSVFEELLVNALVHRDYLVSAPIRIFIFDNRIEIVSPGHLPNNLTVEKIKAGNSNIRNPILISYVAKGLLPYHGLGSGIKRALTDWPDIDLKDDHEGCLFTAIVRRKSLEDGSVLPKTAFGSPNGSLESSLENGKSSPESSLETGARILHLMRMTPTITTEAIGEAIGISKRAVVKQIANLRGNNKVRRVGSTKRGQWEVLD